MARLFIESEINCSKRQNRIKKNNLICSPRLEDLELSGCGVTYSILERIARQIEIPVDDDTKNSLEDRVIQKIGLDPFVWSELMQTKYNNEGLCLDIFKCFRPILPRSTGQIDSKMIQDAIRLYEDVERYSFSFYGPFSSGYKFNPTQMNQRAKKIGFVINTGRTEGI
jgi:hypothetical protein